MVLQQTALLSLYNRVLSIIASVIWHRRLMPCNSPSSQRCTRICQVCRVLQPRM